VVLLTELTGVLGFLLLLGTLLPFMLRRLGLWKEGADFFKRRHHSLALLGLAVLTLHGLSALSGRLHGVNGRHGHGGGQLNWFIGGEMLTGLISWLALLSVIALALLAVRRKPFPRTHCWVVGLLGLLVLSHIL
jgi:hypothetical protein